MHKTVTITLVAIAVAALVIVASGMAYYLGLSRGLSYYDWQTRSELLRVVAKELPQHASRNEMIQFMQRTTTNFSFDEYGHKLIGILPQSKYDKGLFNRKVSLILNISENDTFKNAEVYVYYTFL